MHTEEYFGLEKTSKGITADGGKTLLPKYQDMEEGFFEELVFDVECWLEKELSPQEIEELKDVLTCPDQK